MLNKIKTELQRRMEENNFKAIEIKMNIDKAVIRITPCSYGNITKVEDCEYFLMDCTTINMLGHDTLEEVAKDIMNYQNMKESNNREIEECRQYWLKNVKNSTSPYMDDYYSDWHKDLFGHRPKRRDIFPA